MLRGHSRSRTVSLSSPTGYEHPPPRLGVSGLYTEYLERRRKHSLLPPIPSPLPLDRLIGGGNVGGGVPHHPPPPPRLCNGHAGDAETGATAASLDLLPPPALSSVNNNKRSAAEMSHELSR